QRARPGRRPRRTRAARRARRTDRRRGRGHGGRRPEGPRRRRAHRPGVHRAGLGRPATGAAVAPDPGRRPAHAARPRPGRVAPPPARAAVWRLAAAPLRGFRRTLDERGFTEIPSPKLVGGSAESGADVFAVDHFGRPAYLAQSPQFYKQIMVGVFERVYEVGPVFRAEPHDTVRHLAEYVSLDVELGFVRDHRDVLAVLRDVLAGMVDAIRTEAGAAARVAGS